jgi:hypothetical protein
MGRGSNEGNRVSSGQVVGAVIAWGLVGLVLPLAFNAWVFTQNFLVGMFVWSALVGCFGGALGMIRAALVRSDPWKVGLMSALNAGLLWGLFGGCAAEYGEEGRLPHVEVEDIEDWSPPSEPVFLTVRGAVLDFELPAELVHDPAPQDETKSVTVYQMLPVRSVASGRVSPLLLAGKFGTAAWEHVVSGPAYPLKLDDEWSAVVRTTLAPVAGVAYREDAMRIVPRSETYEDWVAVHSAYSAVATWVARLLSIVSAMILVSRT